MPLPIGKTHDLVLERRALALPDPLNLAVEQGTSFDVASDDFPNALVGVNQPAANLIPKRLRRVERKGNRHSVAWLLDEHSGANLCVEIDAFPIEARRRACLQTPHFETERTNRRSQVPRRWLAVSACRPLFRADMNEAIQKCAGRDHERV